MRTLLSDSKFVSEDYRTKDLLGFDNFISQLLIKTEATPKRSLIGIVGDYGTGKSVMLENLKTRVVDQVHWVHFDAWRYPERNNLWEGFVLDFVSQVSPHDFKQVLKEIDGTSGDANKKLIETFDLTVGTLTNIFVAPGIGTVANKAIDKLSYFANTSPARRVFQIQEIFEKLLAKIDQPICIVVEDADRSGDAGIYFIETLSQFLKNLAVKNEVKVFIPIARKSFQSDKHDAYIKALDIIEFFNIGSRDLTKFVEKVFNLEVIENDLNKNHITEWLQRLISHYKLTIRDIKSIIRNGEGQYKALQAGKYNPDPRIVLIIEACKFVDENIAGVERNVYDYVIINQNRIPNGSQVELVLFAIAQNTTIEQMADILNDLNSNPSVFRRQLRFVDDDKYIHANHNIDSGLPIQLEGQFSLPSYYLL